MDRLEREVGQVERDRFNGFVQRIADLSGPDGFVHTTTGRLISVVNGDIAVDPEGAGRYARYGTNERGELTVAFGDSAFEADTQTPRLADDSERQIFYGGLEAIEERARQVAMFE